MACEVILFYERMHEIMPYIFSVNLKKKKKKIPINDARKIALATSQAGVIPWNSRFPASPDLRASVSCRSYPHLDFP